MERCPFCGSNPLQVMLVEVADDHIDGKIYCKACDRYLATYEYGVYTKEAIQLMEGA